MAVVKLIQLNLAASGTGEKSFQQPEQKHGFAKNKSRLIRQIFMY